MRTLMISGFILVMMWTASSSAAPDLPSEELEKVSRWVKERVKKAKGGETELVRLPVTGCMPSATCPSDFYIGLASSDGASGAWVELTPIKGIKIPSGRYPDIPASWEPELVVEGSFTGKIIPWQDNEVAEEGGDVYKFQVHRVRHVVNEKNDTLLKILLSGAEATRTISAFSDKESWLVISGSYPLSEKDSESKAKELQEKLKSAGFKGAEIFDSRKASRLNCCYLTVVAGRYETKKAAQAVEKEVRKKKLKAYTKQGW